MRITADTNILVRAITGDDPEQGRIAERLLADAELVAIPDVVLCELCWVLDRVYRFKAVEIARAVRALANADNVACNRSNVEAGLAMLEAGADFADGVIALAGQWLGGEMLVSFDRKAVDRLGVRGLKAILPG